MAKIKLDRQTQDSLVRLLRDHLKGEYEFEIGQFETMDLLDFLAETLGPIYYNQGLYDAQALIRARADDIIEAVQAIEKPVKL
ncbi:MAG TPA: DUF2164 domain-containing protein [Caulobacter sp.]|nr:DUF2164 domain-containing protein [Caulobacter sp.]